MTCSFIDRGANAILVTGFLGIHPGSHESGCAGIFMESGLKFLGYCGGETQPDRLRSNGIVNPSTSASRSDTGNDLIYLRIPIHQVQHAAICLE